MRSHLGKCRVTQSVDNKFLTYTQARFIQSFTIRYKQHCDTGLMRRCRVNNLIMVAN